MSCAVTFMLPCIFWRKFFICCVLMPTSCNSSNFKDSWIPIEKMCVHRLEITLQTRKAIASSFCYTCLCMAIYVEYLNLLLVDAYYTFISITIHIPCFCRTRGSARALHRSPAARSPSRLTIYIRHFYL
jgi:hypothetical protein